MRQYLVGLIVIFGFYFAPVWAYQRIRKAPILAKTKGPNAASRFARMHRLNSGNKDSDKEKALEIAKGLSELGFSFTSTEGTAKFLNQNGIKAESTLRISEGRPNVADLIKNGKVQLVINTPLGLIPRRDENGIRQEAVAHSVPVITTLGSAYAALEGIRSLKDRKFSVKSLQDYAKDE